MAHMAYELSYYEHELLRVNIVAGRLSRELDKHFGDELRFLKTWIDKPKALGAILPTSSVTARKMASLIDTSLGGPVLELGPGTGVITKAILAKGVPPYNVYSVEHTDEFIPRLRRDFPDVNIIHGDAFNLDESLPDLDGQKFNAVISAIPMLNFPVHQRVALLEDLFDRLLPGRPVVQISYGPKSPVPPNWATYSVEPLDWMARNLPPARLWVYRRVHFV